ncbi:penicillin-binding protein activator LpoB [Gammaproteobacteria bacterium]|nr:penicillin-binding protein activator LpoB [Gammaproteobacteria bacterium]
MTDKHSNKFRLLIYIFCFFSILQISSCTTIKNSRAAIDINQRIAVLPFTNMTETPQADERVGSIVTDILYTRGFCNIVGYPINRFKPSLIPGVKKPIPRKNLIKWARKQGAQYALIGSVTEWNYKVGLDGEPAVGVNMELINLSSGRVVWTSVGSRIGYSRMAVSQVGIELIDKMIRSVAARWFYPVQNSKCNQGCKVRPH